MWKEKTGRLFRRIRRNAKSLFLVWLPAVFVLILLGFLMLSVILSKDGSFRPCGQKLMTCMQDSPEEGIKRLYALTKCAYKTAWCDMGIIWDKARGKDTAVQVFPGDLPEVDEKADRELFEKLTSDEFLDSRFEELEADEAENPRETDVPPPEELKTYMDQARAERLRFEAEQAEKRKTLAAEKLKEDAVSDDLTRKKTK